MHELRACIGSWAHDGDDEMRSSLELAIELGGDHMVCLTIPGDKKLPFCRESSLKI
jgi:hypothetical protein